MIAKITRGNDAPGLVRYLASGGRHNEHSAQRVIAAGPGIDAGSGDLTDPAVVRSIGFQLDLPRAVHGTHVLYRHPATGERVEGHVWHLSLSNPHGDRALSDREWAEVARDVMDRMGFSGADGRAPCPWVAIGHGRSAAGNDHVHVAVSLVREDGTVASNFRDRVTLSKACSVYEVRYGLAVVAGRAAGSVPAPSRAEIEAAARRGRPEPDRSLLARRVRAAAVAATGEADFVRRLRDDGLMVRPRYAKGAGRAEVEGYSVAVRPVGADRPLFYGGGSLARDLRLPALRASWGQDPTDRGQAASAWRPGTPATRAAPHRSRWDESAAGIERARRVLAAIPVGDREGWAAAARDAAGVLAALSGRLEPARPGQLARTADRLARAAQPPPAARARARPVRRDLSALAAAAQLAEGPTRGWLIVAAQLCELAAAIERAGQAGRDAAEAAARAAAVRAELADTQTRGWSAAGPVFPVRLLRPGHDPAPAPNRRPNPGPDLGHGR